MKNGFLLSLSCFLFAIVIASCASTTAPSAKDTPSAEMAVASSGKSYPASAPITKAPSWAAGQYVVTATTVKGKIDTENRSLIVGKESGGWIIETTTTNKKGKKTSGQMLLLGVDEAMKTGDTSKISMGWMKMQNEDGSIKKIEGKELALFNTFSKSAYENMILKLSGMTPGGDIAVPAGTFAGTFHQKASVKVIGITVNTESWYHSAVPVNGLVRTTDGKTVTELVSFGFDGKPVLK